MGLNSAVLATNSEQIARRVLPLLGAELFGRGQLRPCPGQFGDGVGPFRVQLFADQPGDPPAWARVKARSLTAVS
jgi:hypothetical protein